MLASRRPTYPRSTRWPWPWLRHSDRHSGGHSGTGHAGWDRPRPTLRDRGRHAHYQGAQDGRGGWVATPNVDICRKARRDAVAHALVTSAALIVPDGMPLLWAARLSGNRLVERVAGSSLIFSLTSAAASSCAVDLPAWRRAWRSRPGSRGTGPSLPRPESGRHVRSADRLRQDGGGGGGGARRPSPHGAGHRIRGSRVPEAGTPHRPVGRIPPPTWFIACGAAIPFAAGVLPRAPQWMQRVGLEWMFRLLSEPRRLFRRYLVNDLPYAVGLLASCAAMRVWTSLSWMNKSAKTWPRTRRKR